MPVGLPIGPRSHGPSARSTRRPVSFTHCCVARSVSAPGPSSERDFTETLGRADSRWVRLTHQLDAIAPEPDVDGTTIERRGAEPLSLHGFHHGAVHLRVSR